MSVSKGETWHDLSDKAWGARALPGLRKRTVHTCFLIGRRRDWNTLLKVLAPRHKAAVIETERTRGLRPCTPGGDTPPSVSDETSKE